jgi:hypothetical protein
MKKFKEAHSSGKKFGMGDHYGTGVKNKVGKMREDSLGANAVVPKKLKIPPKSVA